METWTGWVATATFTAVILTIMSERLQITVAALLGALVLIFTHVMDLNEAMGYVGSSYSTLALFFGVMVLVRAFEPTRVFEYLATQMVVMANGQGKRLLIGIVAITTPICAVLPNATTVMLLAPLIPPIAAEVGIDFVPLLILMVFVANSAGLLTLVGDPATFIVGDAINISFVDYLGRLSLGGVCAIAAIVCLIPFLFRDIWHWQLNDLKHLPHPEINRPNILILGGVLMAVVLTLFVVGESFPVPIAPPAVALMGATLALLIAHQSKLDTVNNILKDVDWSTLIFFMCTFILIGGLEKTGVIRNLSELMAIIIGDNIMLAAVVMIFVIGLLSSFVPNIPLVVAMVPLLKQYLVSAGLIGAEFLDPSFVGEFPTEVLPLFYAMMFGATLGGNGTLVGASSNIVAAGISEQHGQRISFARFLKYGMPVMALQLVVSAGYVLLRF